MYRVNAERSQEKNERVDGIQRCTKVTSSLACENFGRVKQPHLHFTSPSQGNVFFATFFRVAVAGRIISKSHFAPAALAHP